MKLITQLFFIANLSGLYAQDVTMSGSNRNTENGWNQTRTKNILKN
jgi:hypothetical protein